MMEKQFWPMRGLPKETNSEFQQKLKWIKLIIFCFYTNPFVACVCAIVLRLYPSWSIVIISSKLGYVCFLLLFIAAFIAGYFISYVHLFTVLYFAVNVNIQMMTITAYFDNMTDDLEETLEAKYTNNAVFYDQDVVRDRLLFGIRQHIQLMR